MEFAQVAIEKCVYTIRLDIKYARKEKTKALIIFLWLEWGRGEEFIKWGVGVIQGLKV